MNKSWYEPIRNGVRRPVVPRGLIDHFQRIWAANNDFASLLVLNTMYNHCLLPVLAENGKLSPCIVTVCHLHQLEMIKQEYGLSSARLYLCSFFYSISNSMVDRLK